MRSARCWLGMPTVVLVVVAVGLGLGTQLAHAGMDPHVGISGPTPAECLVGQAVEFTAVGDPGFDEYTQNRINNGTATPSYSYEWSYAPAELISSDNNSLTIKYPLSAAYTTPVVTVTYHVRVEYTFSPPHAVDEGEATARFNMAVNGVRITPGPPLWWFNGYSPESYPVETTLTAADIPAGSTLLWTVVAGPVALKDGIATTNPVTVASTGASGTAPDALVTLRCDGTVAGSIQLQVLTPHLERSFDPEPWTDTANNGGYRSFVWFCLKDQNGDYLPSADQGIEMNELFPLQGRYEYVGDPGCNWPWIAVTPHHAWVDEPSRFADTISRADMLSLIPRSRVPGPQRDPPVDLEDVPVMVTPQYVFVGSVIEGQGLCVGAFAHLHYQDHGRDEDE